jgi:hypothetical protein
MPSYTLARICHAIGGRSICGSGTMRPIPAILTRQGSESNEHHLIAGRGIPTNNDQLVLSQTGGIINTVVSAWRLRQVVVVFHRRLMELLRIRRSPDQQHSISRDVAQDFSLCPSLLGLA